MELFFPTFPDYEHIDKDCTIARLLRDYHFAIDGVDYVIKHGFEWDGASIPWIMQWKYGSRFDLVHLVGGLVHDAIYADKVEYSDSKHNYHGAPCLADFTRREADAIYRAIIRQFGATVLRSFKEWLAIRLCGWLHWEKR